MLMANMVLVLAIRDRVLDSVKDFADPKASSDLAPELSSL